MCVDPVSTIMTIATVASAGVNAYASIQAGNAEYAAGMYNAQVLERNAQAVEDEKKNVQDDAAMERRRLGERVRAERGEQRAKFAHMGLDTEFGTPFDIDQSILTAGRTDANILGRNEITNLQRLDKEQADYGDGANLSRAQAKSARKAGHIGALGSLLGGAAQVSDRWIQPGAGATRTKPRPIPSTKSLVKVGGG
jgi:hypothetical protein